jgi:cystathionine gamma-synthase
MAAVRGYEEKDPAVTGSLRSGYPRFLVHPFSRRLALALSERHGLSGSTL